MKKFVIAVCIVLFVLFASAFLTYQRFGYKHYLKIKGSVQILDETAKYKALDYFSDTNSRYRGTLALVDPFLTKSIWVWGKEGLKRFTTDNNSLFSLYRTCSDDFLQSFNSGKITLDDRELYKDIGMWKKQVKQGDLVDILLTDKSKIIEIYAYDSWWPFAPIILDKVCKN